MGEENLGLGGKNPYDSEQETTQLMVDRGKGVAGWRRIVNLGVKVGGREGLKIDKRRKGIGGAFLSLRTEEEGSLFLGRALWYRPDMELLKREQKKKTEI